MEDEFAQPVEIDLAEVGKIMAKNRALPNIRQTLSNNQAATINSYNSYSTTNNMPMLRFPAHWLVQIFTLRAFPVLFHIAVHNKKTGKSVTVELYAREAKLNGESNFLEVLNAEWCFTDCNPNIREKTLPNFITGIGMDNMQENELKMFQEAHIATNYSFQEAVGRNLFYRIADMFEEDCLEPWLENESVLMPRYETQTERDYYNVDGEYMAKHINRVIKAYVRNKHQSQFEEEPSETRQELLLKHADKVKMFL